jgi:isoleucyl-tRNA synthetase
MKSGTNSEEKTPSELLSPAALREHEVLQFWDAERIFEKSLAKESPRGNFVFYDGPPYATGMPHFGHLLPSTIKDAIPRYKTMRGFHVSRRWGWDCHGLPIENMIEKELGLEDKKAIIDYGIDKFNKAARDSVFRYDLEWKKVIHRVGRWVDMENNYQTMDSSYTESVWWSFAKFFEKGLVYEGFKSMHVCPRCETTLSNFEVGQGYADVTDISVYAMFPLKDEENTFALAWTTTPWTLHGNVALAVNPELTYVKVKFLSGDNIGKVLILAESRLSVLKEGEYEIVEKFTGTEFADKYHGGYSPVFDTYIKNKFPLETQEKFRDNAWKIYAADFVTADSGSGIVHIASAFGEDDRKLSDAMQLPMLHHVGLNGHARAELGEPFAGKMVKPKSDPQSYDIEIIKALAHAGFLYAKEKFIHSYPHCWRCAFPLLNYSTSGWFVETTKMQEKLLAENAQVNWVPAEIGTGRFGAWLENIRDWNLSRSRFWGAPLPVWRGVDTGKIHVIGSIADLKSKIEKRNSYTIMRHGEAESNVLGIISSKDLTVHGLTDLGRKQVEDSITELQARKSAEGKKITKIYSSDFRRTRETAEIAADLLGIPRDQILFDHRLGECSGGVLDGKSWGEHWNLLSTPRDRMFERVAEGESVFDVKVRATEAMYDMDADNMGDDILVVAHGLPLRLIKYASLGRTARDLLRTGWQDISDPNASLHELDWRNLPHNETWEIDIHRPYVDEVVWTDPETGEKMIRVPEVFDVWYDSGAMPFAQNHYPFEHENTDATNPNTEYWEDTKGGLANAPAMPPQFPADFIAEGLDQTRGWFYSLLAINSGLFDQSPYKNVMVNGLILAEDGRKMSKSLKNYPDLWPTIEKYGADSLRFFLASSPSVRGEEVAFSEKSLDEVNKKIFNRIDNMHSFLAMYALDEKGDPLACSTGKYSDDEVTAMLLSLKHPLDLWVMARLNQTIDLVTTNLENYVLDKATRPIADLIDDVSTWYLRRSRDRFKADATDRDDAVFTLRFVLERLSRIMAPVTPFMAEHVYKKMRFGEIESVHLETWPEAGSIDAEIIDSMKKVRELVEIGLAKRADAKIKVRQPLQSFTHSSNDLSPELEEILKDELNVKEIKFAESTDAVLDIEITSSLREEGAVRDLIRAIQQERKNQDLVPQDAIDIVFGMNSEVEAVINTYLDIIKQAVLGKNIIFVNEVDAKIASGTAVDFAHKAVFDPTTDTARFIIRAIEK